MHMSEKENRTYAGKTDFQQGDDPGKKNRIGRLSEAPDPGKYLKADQI